MFCDARTVLESTFEQVLVTAINTTLKSRESFLANLQNNVATVLSLKNDAVIEDIEKRLNNLQIQLLKLAALMLISSKSLTKSNGCAIKVKALVKNAGRGDLRKRAAEMSIFLRKQPAVIKKYDEKLVRLID